MFASLQSCWLRWRRRFSRAEWCARHFGFALSPDPPHARGVLLIQVDGLARRQLERAMKAGRMPFLRSLLRRHGHELHTHYSGLPSSTPAVQAELHYGVKSAVPSFSFLDRERGTIDVMMYPTVAKRIEAGLAQKGEGLLRGGSSWSNIYTGGAAPEESHFCAASIGFGDSWRSLRLRLVLLVLLMHLDVAFRVIGLLVAELGIGVWDALGGVFGQGRRVGREFGFLAARVAVCVGLRELVTVGASIDLARGLPIVHVNFLGYDEQAHRRGPDSAFAHWALRGIDRNIRILYHVARRSQRRDYEVWVFSDHGQTACQKAEDHVTGGLEEIVRRHWPNGGTSREGGARLQQLPPPGHWLGGSGGSVGEARHSATARLSAFEQEEFAVAAMGPVGQVYFGRAIGADQAHLLAAALVRDGVPGVLWRDGPDEVVWLEVGGEHRLPRDASLLDVDPDLREEVARDLVALCHNPRAGDLVVLGWAPGRVPWSFALENGSHAGPSSDEVLGFALLPPGVWLPEGTAKHLRPETLRAAALHALGRTPAGAGTLRRARPGAVPRAHVRVMTYNVHGCLGSDGRVSPQRVARILDRYNPDIVALQELDVGRRRSRGEDQLAEIARELGMHAAFCAAVGHDDGQYGHGLLARVPIEVEREALLPGGGRREPRAALRVSIPWSDRSFRVLSTHLGLSPEERRSQIAALLDADWIGDAVREPLILCGDLNLHPGSRGYRRLAGILRDVQAHAPGHVARRTFPAVFPVRCLDYVFISGHFEVQSVFIPRDALTLVTSDHLPVGCDLMFA